jgi:hypothetical protein
MAQRSDLELLAPTTLPFRCQISTYFWLKKPKIAYLRVDAKQSISTAIR